MQEHVCAKLNFNNVTTDNAASVLLRSSARYYGGCNKVSKLLANYLKFRKDRILIDSIYSSDGKVIYKVQDILDEFMKFYKDLYTPESLPNISLIQSYLNNIPSPSNGHLNFSVLESDLSLQEISST